MNLAAQSAIVARLPSALQHAFFHFLARIQLGQPGRIDIDMASAACARAAAQREDTLYAVLLGRLHQGDADRRVYLVPEAVRLNEGDAGH